MRTLPWAVFACITALSVCTLLYGASVSPCGAYLSSLAWGPPVDASGSPIPVPTPFVNRFTGYGECYLSAVTSGTLASVRTSIIAPMGSLALCSSASDASDAAVAGGAAAGGAAAGGAAGGAARSAAGGSGSEASGFVAESDGVCAFLAHSYRVLQAVLSVSLHAPASLIHKLALALNGALFSAYNAVVAVALPSPLAAAWAVQPLVHTELDRNAAGGQAWLWGGRRGGAGSSAPSAEGSGAAAAAAARTGLVSLIGGLATTVVTGLYAGSMVACVWDLVSYANVVWLASSLLGANLRLVAAGAARVSKAAKAPSAGAAASALLWLPVVVAAGNVAVFLVMLMLPGLVLGALAAVPGLLVGAGTVPVLIMASSATSVAAALGALTTWLVARLVREGHLGTARLFFVVYFDASGVPDESALLHAVALTALRVLFTPFDRAVLAWLAAAMEWQTAKELLDDLEGYTNPRRSLTKDEKTRAVAAAVPHPPSVPRSAVPTPRGFSTHIEAQHPLDDDDRVISFVEYEPDGETPAPGLTHRAAGLDTELQRRLEELGAGDAAARPPTVFRVRSRRLSPSPIKPIVDHISRSVSVALETVSSTVAALDASRPSVADPFGSPPRASSPPLRKSTRASAKKATARIAKLAGIIERGRVRE